MAITIRDAKSPPRQRNIASLVGGFVIAGGCFVLFVLVDWISGKTQAFNALGAMLMGVIVTGRWIGYSEGWPGSPS